MRPIHALRLDAIRPFPERSGARLAADALSAPRAEA
jgi:hypothetical protein